MWAAVHTGRTCSGVGVIPNRRLQSATRPPSGRLTWWNSRTDGESPDGRQHETGRCRPGLASHGGVDPEGATCGVPRSSSVQHHELQGRTPHAGTRSRDRPEERLPAGHRGRHPDRAVPAALDRADRRAHRGGVGLVRNEAPRLGLAGRHPRQRHAVLRLPRRALRCRRADAALRPGGPTGLLHPHQHLRLVAVGPDPPAEPRW